MQYLCRLASPTSVSQSCTLTKYLFNTTWLLCLNIKQVSQNWHDPNPFPIWSLPARTCYSLLNSWVHHPPSCSWSHDSHFTSNSSALVVGYSFRIYSASDHFSLLLLLQNPFLISPIIVLFQIRSPPCFFFFFVSTKHSHTWKLYISSLSWNTRTHHSHKACPPIIKSLHKYIQNSPWTPL